MSHDSMDMSSDGSACKITMIWNWYTIDACFLAESWHIKSNGMFAASCIGIALLVVCLEFLRRVGKEHEAYLLRQFQRNLRSRTSIETALEPGYATFRATPLQQLCRAVIHGVTLGLAYIVMLLAMHYNGYVIISIILGSILGKFLCDWLVVRVPYGGSGKKEDRSASFDVAGPTGCCA